MGGSFAGLCGRCGGPKRRRTARTSDATTTCTLCKTPICRRHARYDPDGDRDLCTRCARRNGVRVIKTAA